MNKNVEKYIKLVSSNDPKISENAYNHLWQMEEVGELSAEAITKFFKDKENSLLIQYAVDALGRLKNPAMYSTAADCFTHTQDVLILQSFLEGFRATESDFFIDVVLKKIGYKKNLITGNYKKDEARWNKLHELHYFILIHATKYLEVCVTKSHLEILLDLLKHKDSAVRFHVLTALYNQKIYVDQKIIDDIAKNDPYVLNVRQAELIIESMYDKSEKDNPYSYIL